MIVMQDFVDDESRSYEAISIVAIFNVSNGIPIRIVPVTPAAVKGEAGRCQSQPVFVNVASSVRLHQSLASGDIMHVLERRVNFLEIGVRPRAGLISNSAARNGHCRVNEMHSGVQLMLIEDRADAQFFIHVGASNVEPVFPGSAGQLVCVAG